MCALEETILWLWLTAREADVVEADTEGQEERAVTIIHL